MENKHLLKLLILGLTFAGLTAGLLRWAETETAAQEQNSLLADNVWTAAAGGLWNTTDANWTNPAVWNNANVDSAIFSGAAVGPIQASVPITLRGMRFDVNGYSVTAPGALTFAAGGGGSLAAGEIQVATGVSTEMNNVLSGTVGLTKTGGGTLILFNSSSSNYTGTTTISAGKLQIGFGVFGSGGNIPNNPVSMAANTTLEFRRSQNFTFSGQITAAGGASVVKSGVSAMTISANGNRLSNLTVNAGTLLTTGTDNLFSIADINGGTFLPGDNDRISQLNVSGGTVGRGGSPSCGELNLSGGTLATSCNVGSPYRLTATGGTISPGGQGPGTVTPNNATLNSATKLHIEIDPNGTDQLVAFAYFALPVNSINLGGAQLTGALTNGYNPAPGQQFIIVAKGGFVEGAGSISGQFAQGSQVTFSGRRFSITYTSSNVTLTALARTTPFDFDGDSKADIGIYRPSNGQWWYQRSSNNQVFAFEFGNSTDRIMPADYTGDGKTDAAFWRPSTGEWFVLRSEDNTYYSIPYGLSSDTPTPGDFDADGKTDQAVFRPSNATWYIHKSSGGDTTQQFGQTGDVPVVGDYDGDGKADVAIFRPSLGQWWINRSTAGDIVFGFGNSTDKPVQGDYTGDAKADVAFWRPSTGEWFVVRSQDISSYYSVPFGTTGDTPAPGDYDGDGKFDTAVFRPSNQNWYVDRTTSGLLIQQFGLANDKPVPSAFVP